ncbi:MAG: transglutaminase family protein [Brevirhabdus sp.]
MRLRIKHTTRYSFDSPVSFGLQQLRKTPKSTPAQNVVYWTTQVSGGKRELVFEDHHHNTVELVSFDKDITEFSVQCEGEIEATETHGIVGRHRGPTPLWLFRRATKFTRAGAGCRSLLRKVGGDTPLDQMHALLHAVRDAVRYEIGSSETGWSAEEVLSHGSGVCQDHTHVFIACARELGLPARYVSGYLMMDDRVEQDAMHAWAEIHVPDLGWVGFDVSNGISPDRRYVRVATGLDYSEAAPVTGSRLGGAGEALSVAIEVAQQ